MGDRLDLCICGHIEGKHCGILNACISCDCERFTKYQNSELDEVKKDE